MSNMMIMGSPRQEYLAIYGGFSWLHGGRRNLQGEFVVATVGPGRGCRWADATSSS